MPAMDEKKAIPGQGDVGPVAGPGRRTGLDLRGDGKISVSRLDAPAGMQAGPEWKAADGVLVQNVPHQRTASDPRNSSVEAGAIPDVSFIWTGTGYAPVPGQEAKNRIEDDFFSEMAWNIRNRLIPSVLPFEWGDRPPPYDAGKGRHWLFNPVFQEYRSVPDGWESGNMWNE